VLPCLASDPFSWPAGCLSPLPSWFLGSAWSLGCCGLGSLPAVAVLPCLASGPFFCWAVPCLSPLPSWFLGCAWSLGDGSLLPAWGWPRSLPSPFLASLPFLPSSFGLPASSLPDGGLSFLSPTGSPDESPRSLLAPFCCEALSPLALP